MEPEENKRSIRHIRLPVKEYTGERGFYWKRKNPVEPPGRDYTEGVKEILQSSFTVEGKQFNIFKITLGGKPTPSEIDKIFNWFKAQPAFYFSPHEILLKSLSEDFSKVAKKLLKKVRKEIRLFVEEVRLLQPEEKMASELVDVVLQKKGLPEELKLIVFLVPGFERTEIQDLQRQISSLISEPGNLGMVDLDNGILLSSANVEDARSLAEKPYIFCILEDIELEI